jgi:hypothetical protein
MEMTKQNKIILSAVAVLVLLGVYIAFDNKSKEVSDVREDSFEVASTTENGGFLIDSEGTGDYTIVPVPVDEGREPVAPAVPVPSTSRPVTFASSVTLTPEVKKIITDNILATQASLKKNNQDLEKWIELGLYQKMAGDYEGAIISWKYVGAAADRDFISYGNLGNLYAYYLKDRAQAEIYYRQAITNGPTQQYLYVQLFEVYRDVFQDMDKAKAIVEEGLRKLPGNKALLQIKDSM